jgi:hypothetical protein
LHWGVSRALLSIWGHHHWEIGKNIVEKEQEVLASLAGLEDFLQPKLNIVIMMYDVFHEECHHSNNCHLEFLSIAMELLDETVSLKEVNGWSASIWILQSIFVNYVINFDDHALEVLLQFSTTAQSISENDLINLMIMQLAIAAETYWTGNLY